MYHGTAIENGGAKLLATQGTGKLKNEAYVLLMDLTEACEGIMSYHVS